jgi:hypothetical protein
MNGAVNHGASIDEVRAVRDMVISLCEREGMQKGGRGWKGDIAKL